MAVLLEKLTVQLNKLTVGLWLYPLLSYAYQSIS